MHISSRVFTSLQGVNLITTLKFTHTNTVNLPLFTLFKTFNFTLLKASYQRCDRNLKQSKMKGLIFIPDISGFTEFVKNTEINLGASITLELFNEIIDNNPLKLELTEIEGDALLFYKIGEPLPLSDILSAFKSIFNAFNNRYKVIKYQHNLKVDLSLKCIVHYGELKVYNIKGFRNLFGQVVIESHNLLKNGCGESEYILVTEDYLNALKLNPSNSLYPGCEYISASSKLSNSLRCIPYNYYKNTNKQLVGQKEAATKTKVFCTPEFALV